MTYDVAMRHQQALDPSSLITVFTTLHAAHFSASHFHRLDSLPCA